jgi:hypothetical protein
MMANPVCRQLTFRSQSTPITLAQILSLLGPVFSKGYGQHLAQFAAKPEYLTCVQ